MLRDLTSLRNSEHFGTSKGLAGNLTSSLTKRWTSLSDIVCFGKYSFDFVVSHFTPKPLSCANVDPADAMRVCAYLRVSDEVSLNILKKFLRISPRKWAEILYVLYYYHNRDVVGDNLMLYVDTRTLHYYGVDYFDLPTRYDGIFVPSLKLKFEQPSVTLRDFRAFFMEEHHAYNFRKSSPLLAYDLCSKCHKEHFISCDLSNSRQVCCPGVRSFCEPCYNSTFTNIICEENWTDDALPSLCQLLHKNLQPVSSPHQHHKEPVQADPMEFWNPQIFDI